MGAPRDMARTVLLVGTYSHIFATANINNWFRCLNERLHEHAQYEIRVFAVELLNILETLYPVCVKAFKKAAQEAEDFQKFKADQKKS